MYMYFNLYVPVLASDISINKYLKLEQSALFSNTFSEEKNDPFSLSEALQNEAYPHTI